MVRRSVSPCRSIVTTSSWTHRNEGESGWRNCSASKLSTYSPYHCRDTKALGDISAFLWRCSHSRKCDGSSAKALMFLTGTFSRCSAVWVPNASPRPSFSPRSINKIDAAGRHRRSKCTAVMTPEKPPPMMATSYAGRLSRSETNGSGVPCMTTIMYNRSRRMIRYSAGISRAAFGMFCSKTN